MFVVPTHYPTSAGTLKTLVLNNFTISSNEKLQVFVSSTYTDLKDERQAAVEAILDAGHIPAGMELFKAGNDSQLKTVYKWNWLCQK